MSSHFSDICGLADASPPVSHSAGGMETDIKMAPWMVSLGKQDGSRWNHQCGGTIIGPHAILTAAHCKQNM